VPTSLRSRQLLRTALRALDSLTGMAWDNGAGVLAEEREGETVGQSARVVLWLVRRVPHWCPAAGGELTAFAAAGHLARNGTRSEGQAMAGGIVRVRRVYEEPEPGDGTRVLVDRIWPRGLTKAKAALDEWCKDVAPSDELRRWYGHDPDRFEEFGRRYQLELQDPRRAEALAHLRGLARDRRLTLLTATRQPEISEAAVLADLLRS
jgi:uncharacterized protein YeaO (DUF488 family)